jgi:hypothetical protein
MARSSGLSKVLVLVHLVLIYLPNSPLKRCLNYFSDSFCTAFSEVRMPHLPVCPCQEPANTAQNFSVSGLLPNIWCFPDSKTTSPSAVSISLPASRITTPTPGTVR